MIAQDLWPAELVAIADEDMLGKKSFDVGFAHKFCIDPKQSLLPTSPQASLFSTTLRKGKINSLIEQTLVILNTINRH